MIEVGEFALKVLVVVLGIGSIIILIAMLAAKAQEKHEFEVEPLHKKMDDLKFFLKSFTSTKEELKEERKKLKQQEKDKEKSTKKALKDGTPLPVEKRLFVLDFDGDLHASAVENLREEVTAVLSVATTQDEVVAKITSPGGVVHSYGLAASQLLRIRERGIPLTVCVDEVAASGGYLMSCVANQIIAAPFAIIGSIGVVAQVPNFNRLLKKFDVDYKEYTAGDFKRTVSLFGEITEKGEAKFVEQLESTHTLFKKFVSQYRPQLNLAQVATGEYWYGTQAKDLGLIDKIQTSDDYLLASAEKDVAIYELKYQRKQSLSDKISNAIGATAEKTLLRSLSRLQKQNII